MDQKYKRNYFQMNQITKPNFHFDKIKTIILNTPEGCLREKEITKKLIEEGHKIVPTAQFPNEIRISYIEKNNNNNENNQREDYNIIQIKNGSYGLAYFN